jgi:2-oxoglutarate ferredoxin oxidoreductase subunit delta
MMPDSKKKKPTNIDIYKAWCKACGICVAFCPTRVLARDETGYPYVKEPDKCIGCGWCEIRCPDFAITVKKKDKKDRAEKNYPEASNGAVNAGENIEEEAKEGAAASGQ